MNKESDARPILIVPYMWIGDFVRCHSVVRVLNERFPGRPVDMLASKLTAPLTAFMPGVRKAITFDIPRKKAAFAESFALAKILRAENYGAALIMSRKWKAAFAPWLAGIPERTGVFGEARFPLINDIRWDEKQHKRMIDQSCALALPKNAPLPGEWPLPQLVVSEAQADEWRGRMNVAKDTRAVALAPGSVGEAKRWPVAYYAETAKQLVQGGVEVWIIGGPDEKEFAKEILAHAEQGVRDFTGGKLSDGVIALSLASAVVANDSGLLHVSAALGVPAIGMFGPTDPAKWAPINPVADIITHEPLLDCQFCMQYVCPLQHHNCMREVLPPRVVDSVRRAMTMPGFVRA
ncbi:MAG: lipopolysaccharide heptosyltransferase II [Xanthobacteraceae bacterium]|nr:lipopolysaccharide heptosyltransferase II [Xanthobacteraceae bacterium]MCW5679262.1 lipopolysaccharide heptosyltransferase II [Xanthobacteraceae bacterium]